MSQRRKTPRSASVAPLYAAQPQRTPARRRAGALLMGTALSAVIGLGYGRGAYAQTVLSGAQTDTQALTGPGEFVTEDGFSVDTSSNSGIAIDATGSGDMTFTDDFASSISGATDGIAADIIADGALTITTTGNVTGDSGYGIQARSEGRSATALTVDAYNVTGGSFGISAYLSHPGRSHRPSPLCTLHGKIVAG